MKERMRRRRRRRDAQQQTSHSHFPVVAHRRLQTARKRAGHHKMCANDESSSTFSSSLEAGRQRDRGGVFGDGRVVSTKNNLNFNWFNFNQLKEAAAYLWKSEREREGRRRAHLQEAATDVSWRYSSAPASNGRS